MTMPQAERDIDDLVPRKLQDAWVSGAHEFKIQSKDRPDLSRQVIPYRNRFAGLQALGLLPQLHALFRVYRRIALLDAARTELSFWCVSLLKDYSKRTLGAISRVN